jgi:hypothetical protein
VGGGGWEAGKLVPCCWRTEAESSQHILEPSRKIWKRPTTPFEHNHRWYDVGLGHAVAQLVEALRRKPDGRRFDFPWCPWNFWLT